MKPYSDDLRCRVIKAIQENQETQEEIGVHFGVSTSFVEKLWHRFQTTGSYQAKPHSGGRRRLLEGAEAVIRQLVAAEPDLTLAELAEKVARQSNTQTVSEAVMCVELQRLELPLKKSRFMPVKATWNVLNKKEKNMLLKALK